MLRIAGRDASNRRERCFESPGEMLRIVRRDALFCIHSDFLKPCYSKQQRNSNTGNAVRAAEIFRIAGRDASRWHPNRREGCFQSPGEMLRIAGRDGSNRREGSPGIAVRAKRNRRDGTGNKKSCFSYAVLWSTDMSSRS